LPSLEPTYTTPFETITRDVGESLMAPVQVGAQTVPSHRQSCGTSARESRRRLPADGSVGGSPNEGGGLDHALRDPRRPRMGWRSGSPEPARSIDEGRRFAALPSYPPQVFDRVAGIAQTEQVFDSCVLGVDPGVSALGLAAVARHERKPVLLFADTVRTASDLPDATRLWLLHEAVASAISIHRPGSVAIERIAWNKNQVSAMIVARATGVILLAAAEAGLEVGEYGSLEVKMAVTGQGNADKAQVRMALERFHGLKDLPDQADAVDAAAIALCHLTQARLRKVAAR
jgi:crossover junction endodeoxyribonuclease RuvC